MALIGRVFVVLFAFLLASAAAGLVLTLGLLPPEFDELVLMPGAHAGFGMAAAIAAFVVSGYALIPAMLCIVLAEAFRLRSFLLYAGFGAVLALLIADGPNVWMEGASAASFAGREQEVFAAAGIAAGLTYWALAGRRAGAWRRVPPPARAPAG